MRSDEGGRPTDPHNLWISTSRDDGHTWAEPWILNHFGVLPQLLTLGNGVTAVSYGRPGVELRFCCDPEGKIWTRPPWFSLIRRAATRNFSPRGRTASSSCIRISSTATKRALCEKRLSSERFALRTAEANEARAMDTRESSK